MSEQTLMADWSRELFRVLKIGGVWGVPRSGLMFQRVSENELALTARMPHDPAMSITEDELIEQQTHEYEGVKRHFGNAGITVTDRTGGKADGFQGPDD